MKVGFIGLGVMGRPMARHIAEAGHELHLYSRTLPDVADIVKHGAVVAESSRAVAAASDVVILMVQNTSNVEEVLFGDNGVAGALARGATVIDMSSISPIATRGFAERLAQQGCDYLDAPVSGGEVGAEAASLTIMVGGKQEVFDRFSPLLALMGKSITRIGEVGAGQTAKVANQIIVALTIEAVGEALLFAARAGVDPARVREALLGGFASSRILEVHGKRMIERTFAPGFRIELHQKDLNLALEAARELHAVLPGTALCQQLFNSCAALGGGGDDHSGLVRALETMTGFEIGSAPG